MDPIILFKSLVAPNELIRSEVLETEADELVRLRELEVLASVRLTRAHVDVLNRVFDAIYQAVLKETD